MHVVVPYQDERRNGHFMFFQIVFCELETGSGESGLFLARWHEKPGRNPSWFADNFLNPSDNHTKRLRSLGLEEFCQDSLLIPASVREFRKFWAKFTNVLGLITKYACIYPC